MRSKTTSTQAIHLRDGWHDRLGKGLVKRVTPLGLILMLFALFVPNIASAEIITTEYDFSGTVYGTNGNDGNTTTEYSSETVRIGSTPCTYFQTLGNVPNPGRFAAQVTTFSLRKSTGSNPTYGLNLTGYGSNQYRMFAITQLYSGDQVIVEGSANFDLASGSSSASVNGNTYTMNEKGSLALSIPGSGWIYKITVKHDDVASWGYDPAIETYDMYGDNSGIQANNLASAGFPLDYDDLDAKFLTNLSSGLALNNRVAISQVLYNGNTLTPWSFDHGLKSQWAWHNIAICNLVEGDRVVITYIGQAKFSSKAENTAYNGCAAFRDNGNDGDFNEGTDANITCGMSVEAKSSRWDYNVGANINTSYPYVITESGHLDIALPADGRICKIEIYGDHQAQMVDKDTQIGPNDYASTSYFNTTGQLEAKQHIVPGGLNVYVGNDNLSQHAEVVSSDKGPVSFVYDQSHYKMARHATGGSFNVWSELPATGTFYKFVPEVSGTMWVKFKAVSINYRDYFNTPGNGTVDANGTPNEVTNGVSCPYYLMVEQNGRPQQIEVHNYANGADGYFGADNGNPTVGANKGIKVERGKTYYLYGWWDNTDDAFNITSHACGVAELLEVSFRPEQMVEPLAKWVESGTTSDDNLARVRGYRNVTIKKKSDNIASCTAYIEGDRLKIKDITFVDENKGGGTILIKVGDPNIDADPVFAYTIAYNAGYNMNDETGRTEGHVWNFSDKPLKGLKWNNKNAEADEAIFGPYFNNFATATKDDNGVPTNGVNQYCFLYDEMNKQNPDGTKHADWTFNYRVKKNGQFHDPRFLNNYDMEGDNADMMWDTEGIIINAGSTQSCIFDEFCLTNNREIDHTNKTQADPDRYVGFLPGGSFIIPKLKKDDRVVVYMGSGEGSGAESMELHITNARDAVYNEIDPEDFYHAGGSMWNVPDGHKDPYYRGCYHFFALADGDMVFEMARGSMCKLYEIRIYRGTRYGTNGVQENGKGYTIFAAKDQQGNLTTSETNSWNIHYRGKGERVADGSGKYNQENEVLAHSGNITHCQNSDLVRLSSGQGIEYTNQGEIGMLRVRVKCMEFNYNYVTDFADRNFTLALHETQSYPYTWDFTDIDLFSGYGDKAETNNILGEYENYNELQEGVDEDWTWYEPQGRELSMWDADGNMILYGPESNDQALYYTNQNMIFENSKGIDGNQLYANGDVIPETRGLWFYFDNNDPGYNGSTQVTAEGLRLSNTLKLKADGSYQTMGWWNTKMVVPSVPSGDAVYLRVKRDATVAMADYSQKPNEDPVYFLANKFHFGYDVVKDNDGNVVSTNKSDIADGARDNSCRFYKVDGKTAYTPSDDEDEYIIAILNTGETSNLTLTLNGWIVEKLSVSEDPKAVNIKGWTTESRSRVIDPELTAFLTGYDFETCLVTGFDPEKRTVTLSRVYDPTAESNDALVMRSFTGNGQNGANIIHNIANEEVQILNNGFHLFVPDMHDYIAGRTDGITNEKDITNGNSWENLLVSQLAAGTIPYKETRTWKTSSSDTGESLECTNYAMSYRYYVVNQEGEIMDPTVQSGDEAFYRIVKGGASSSANKGYLPLPTRDMTNSKGEYSNKYTLVYEGDDTFDAIQDVKADVNYPVDNVYYTIDGQMLNGVPTTSGIYIVNGKKVVIK